MSMEFSFLLSAALAATALELLVAPGLGLLLAVLCLAGLTYFLMRSLERRAFSGAALAWCVPLGFAAMVTVYDSPVVAGWGAFLALWSALCAGYLSLRGPYHFDQLSGVAPDTLVCSLTSPTEIAAGLTPLGSLRREGTGRLVKGLLGGVGMSCVFGLLFCSADAIFAERVQACLGWLDVNLAVSCLRIGLLALLVLGFVRKALFRKTAEPRPVTPSQDDWLTSSIALACLNLLFASFLVIQVRYLFLNAGDFSQLGLNFATYARKGFFELATCTVLVFLIGHHCYSRHYRDTQPWPRLLCAALALQTFGVVASALRRMSLYCDEFGLSVLRIYAVLGILAMVLCLAVLLWAHLCRPSVVRMRSALVLAGTLTLLAAGTVNVDDSVARFNLRREKLDAEYLGELSCDAVPALWQAACHHDKPDVRRLCRQAVVAIFRRTCDTGPFGTIDGALWPMALDAPGPKVREELHSVAERAAAGTSLKNFNAARARAYRIFAQL